VSATSIYQTGYPSRPHYSAVQRGGRLQRDGDNQDIRTSQATRKGGPERYLTGVFTSGHSRPRHLERTQRENQQFRQPNFSETDLTAYKTRI